VIHFDASLPTLSTNAYGYNTVSGGYVTKMSNLSDPTMATDAIGYSAVSSSIARPQLGGTGSNSNIFVVIPSTQNFAVNFGLSSSVTYNTSSTQSTYFAVSTSYTNEINTTIAAIRSNGSINVAQSITDRIGFLHQSNKSTSNVVGAYFGTENLGTKYLTKLRGSSTEYNGGTTVVVNGATWSYSSGYVDGSTLTYTGLLGYYVETSPDNRGKTMSFNEIIYFDYSLSDSEFNAVESYLKTKWAISY
jgi:hypothetical protein